MTEYFAHSPKAGQSAQTYKQHIDGVLARVQRYASDVVRYSVSDGQAIRKLAELAAIYHDLGKLAPENQLVLSGRKTARSLPLNHADAGTAFLLDDKHTSVLAALAVAAHHIGLPDFIEEKECETPLRDAKIRDVVDKVIAQYVSIHSQLIHEHPPIEDVATTGNLSVFLRLLLSCLADADHSDAAVHSGQYPASEPHIELRATERLAALDTYVAGLGNSGGERDKLRGEMYTACRNANVSENIASCDSPVGSGKTTAVMAHLLTQAQRCGLRRIFVVLPFTNIIKQSAKIYRNALVLPGENSEDVVAELHHRADFESEDIRYLTALWRAPIIVTTAVAFFETLATHGASALRRLHELPGSAIFVDEAHAALPAKLLPIAWHWMNTFADEWSCYWVLASGSLNRFWEIEEIAKQKRNVPSITASVLQESLDIFESTRIAYKHDLRLQNLEEFAKQVRHAPGPQIVILNTVQSAAVVAKYFCDSFGRDSVEHLSTALIPSDREKTLERVKTRLANRQDSSWSLIATSCVEAGVDLSFHTGFRELASLTSLLQAAGRVNRNGEYGVSVMYTFTLAENEMLKTNPGLKNAASVLRGFIEAGAIIEPALVTKSIKDEIKKYGENPISKKLLEQESGGNFPFVDKEFNVIDTDTRIAVVDEAIVKKIRNGHINWCELQRNSLQIASYKLRELHISQIIDEIYHWNLGYDEFIGYMSGVIEAKKFDDILIV